MIIRITPATRRGRWRPLYLLAWSLMPLLLVTCGAPPPGAIRVLFIGNSYTSENDLPGMLAALAAAGNHPLIVEQAAPGGWTLMQHLRTRQTLERLGAWSWDYVVLQEQSVIPALPRERAQQMAPAARELARQIRARGARPLFYLTWGRRDGLASAGYRDFSGMQAALTDGYRAVATALDAPIAPVGPAWQAARARIPGVALWQTDGSHPSRAGSYLAACVFYAAIARQSPEGLPTTAGVPDELAGQLQRVARDTVLANPAAWGLR